MVAHVLAPKAVAIMRLPDDEALPAIAKLLSSEVVVIPFTYAKPPSPSELCNELAVGVDKVIFPEVVTVPDKENPSPEPVPLTLVTVPELDGIVAHVLSPRKYVDEEAEPDAKRAVEIVPEVIALASADKVPPRVRFPEVVTVPLKLMPDTVPVPLTLVTVPLPPPPDGVAQVPSFRKNVVVEPVGCGIEYAPQLNLP